MTWMNMLIIYLIGIIFCLVWLSFKLWKANNKRKHDPEFKAEIDSKIYKVLKDAEIIGVNISFLFALLIIFWPFTIALVFAVALTKKG